MTLPSSEKPVSIDFEQSLEELESIVKRLETGELKLDDALSAFETGIRLSRECQSALQEAEQRVKTLVEDQQGTLVEKPFTPDAE